MLRLFGKDCTFCKSFYISTLHPSSFAGMFSFWDANDRVLAAFIFADLMNNIGNVARKQYKDIIRISRILRM